MSSLVKTDVSSRSLLMICGQMMKLILESWIRLSQSISFYSDINCLMFIIKGGDVTADGVLQNARHNK